MTTISQKIHRAHIEKEKELQMYSEFTFVREILAFLDQKLHKTNVTNHTVTLSNGKVYDSHKFNRAVALARNLKSVLNVDQLEYRIQELEYLAEINKPSEPKLNEFEKWWREAEDKNYKLSHKINEISSLLYRNLNTIRDFTLPASGVKFIVQESKMIEGIFRFCYDPYQLVSNYHSSLDEIFSENGEYYTRWGGWMQITGDKLILFKSSGDYGEFKPEIAIDAAEKVFPELKVVAFPNKELIDCE